MLTELFKIKNIVTKDMHVRFLYGQVLYVILLGKCAVL